MTPWTTAHQVSLFFTISQSLLKLVSTKLVMLSNHLILCCPLLLLPSIFPSIRVFSNELALHIRWPKYWMLSLVNIHHLLLVRKRRKMYFFFVKRTLRIDCLRNLLFFLTKKKFGWHHVFVVALRLLCLWGAGLVAPQHVGS